MDSCLPICRIAFGYSEQVGNDKCQSSRARPGSLTDLLAFAQARSA